MPGSITDRLSFLATAVPFAVGLLLGMLLCLEFGRRVGTRRLRKDPGWTLSGLSVVEGAVFGLYGLLLAFTFSGAPSRLDARKQLIAAESNAINTAYLRLDLLSAESQPALRELFRQYLDSRIKIYRDFSDVTAAKPELARCSAIQIDIWERALAATRMPRSHLDAARLLLPALNDMIDITTTRLIATTMHPPPVIYALIFLLALACSLLAGYSMSRERQHSWLHIVTFALVTVISVYTFLEIEYPRMGAIRLLGTSDQALVDLRDGMK